MSNDKEMPPRLADDLVWGNDAIAREIGRSRRQVEYLIFRKLIPITKIGGLNVASRRKLAAHMTGETSEQP